MPASGCDGEDFTRKAAHLVQFDDAVAGGVDDLESVADLETIFHVDLGDAVYTIQNVTDILLARIFRMAAQVILLFVGMMAFVKAVGVAAVRQRIQGAQQ